MSYLHQLCFLIIGTIDLKKKVFHVIGIIFDLIGIGVIDIMLIILPSSIGF